MDIIVDLDGTVADCDWRLHFIENKPKNWKAFFDGIPKDKVIFPVYNLVEEYLQENSVIFCTARPEQYRNTTSDWIKTHFGMFCTAPLYMRPKNDHRPDYEMKKVLLNQMRADGFNPALAIDDSPKVCEMYEEEGLVVLQVKRKKNVSKVD